MITKLINMMNELGQHCKFDEVDTFGFSVSKTQSKVILSVFDQILYLVEVSLGLKVVVEGGVQLAQLDQYFYV